MKFKTKNGKWHEAEGDVDFDGGFPTVRCSCCPFIHGLGEYLSKEWSIAEMDKELNEKIELELQIRRMK